MEDGQLGNIEKPCFRGTMGLLEHRVKTLKPAWEITDFLEEEAFQLILKRYGKVS